MIRHTPSIFLRNLLEMNTVAEGLAILFNGPKPPVPSIFRVGGRLAPPHTVALPVAVSHFSQEHGI